MSKAWKQNVAAFLLGALAVPAGAHEPITPVQSTITLSPAAMEAASVTDAFHAALRAGNVDGALALLADDAVIFESGGVERGKAAYAGHHLAADAIFSKATTRTVTDRSGQAADAMAWIGTETRVTGTYKDREINLVGTETMVLRRQSDGWKIVHIHWSSSKAP